MPLPSPRSSVRSTLHQPQSRRRFLRTALASLALPALPALIPGRALGRGARAAPSERLRVALIGCGNQGGGHLGHMLGHRDVQVVAVCDVDGRKRERAAQRVAERYAAEGGTAAGARVPAYVEFEAVLARDDLDAVLIAVPDHWHAAIAIAACAAGVDVYCEKPLSLTVREAEAMVRAARRHGTVFQTGSQQRSSTEFRFACEMVRSGRIGELREVHVGIGAPSADCFLPEEPVPPELDWERWLGPAPWAPYNAQRASGSYSGGWRLVRDYSGGMTTDWGAHHFDIAQWALGRDGDGPIEILPPDAASGRDLTFRYADGIPMTRGGADGIRFTGSEGEIEVNRGKLRSSPASLKETPTRPVEVQLRRSPGHFQDWLDCIRTRRRPLCDVAIGASSVTVCHLGNIACWLGRAIRWDPAKREIVGDERAARWLDRARRAPYRLHDCGRGGAS